MTSKKRMPHEVTASEFFKHDEAAIKSLENWRKKGKR